MELLVHAADRDTLTAALKAGAAGVAVSLPRGLEAQGWMELTQLRAETRRRRGKFYLVWDWLPGEDELAGTTEVLTTAAALKPEALVLRDLGLTRLARERHPQLPLHAAANWGAYNSPGLRLAARLGFSRAVLAGPLSLTDLALIRRQTDLPLEVALPSGWHGFPGLQLLEESPAGACPGYGNGSPAETLLQVLEALSGLASLQVEAVQLPGDLVPLASLPLLVELVHQVCRASPAERPQVLAAARRVTAAFEDRLGTPAPASGAIPPVPPPPASPAPPRHPEARRFQGVAHARKDVWVEARDYPEAAALTREWAGVLVLRLTPENYAAFLRDHRRWTPRRLIWRLPPMLRESALAFYRQALDTLKQGGYSRFITGDWGGVALARAAGGEVFGDQTLGVRNSWALEAARPLGVRRVCLPPNSGPQAWEDLVRAAPPASFWTYLYHLPVLAVCPAAPTAREQLPSMPRLRWLREGETALLCPQIPEYREEWLGWLRHRDVFPLLVALPLSGLPRDHLPNFLLPAPAGKRRLGR